MFNNKKILITGGTGSFGNYFIKTLLKRYKPKKIIIFSRDELKQYEMQKKYPENIYPNLRFFLGDIRDFNRLEMATSGVDYIIHAAALKQVPAAEYNPFEAIKTNILGAQNVIDAAIKNNVKKILALSTDKAAAPINLYGATKLCSDKLFISANNYVGNKDIKFSVVRYGNVMGSRGSIIPYLIEQKANKTFPLTDKRMTRFNITLKQGVDFVINSMEGMFGGELFVPKMPSYKLLDVAKAIDEKAELKYVGIRPGEKIHEELITKSDSLRTIEFKNHYVILPNQLSKGVDEDYLMQNSEDIGSFVQDGFSYASDNNENFLSVEEIKCLIKKMYE
jgi:UDP-N-acetylglucosamine 4,6-dehydratase (inverting)